MTIELPDYLPTITGEWASNAVVALTEDIVDELKLHGRSILTLRLQFVMLPNGVVQCKATRRLAHAPDVVETLLSMQKLSTIVASAVKPCQNGLHDAG